jgi:hypothetical protein
MVTWTLRVNFNLTQAKPMSLAENDFWAYLGIAKQVMKGAHVCQH